MTDEEKERVLELDDRGLKGYEIAELVGRSANAVSRTLRAAGRAKKERGVRRPRARTFRRTCASCGKVDMVRSDHSHTILCPSCASASTCFRPGHAPHNRGVREVTLTRKCETCGGEFSFHRSRLDKKPRCRWATFCSKACYGQSLRTPGSRYSEVGRNWPSRRRH